jgi:pimeloyl-ACP methyl ester carboxylesterase
MNLYVETTGDGEPVVFVHGSWSDHHAWDAVVPELPAGFKAVTYDRRGHSASTGEGSLLDDIADLEGIIEEPAHLVGSSLGAQIALRLAIARPDLVRSLALHEPGFWSLEPGDASIQAMQASLRQALAMIEQGRDEDGARAFADLVLGPDAWDTALPEALRRTMVANTHTFLEEERDTEVAALDLPIEIDHPTLLTTGDESDPAFHVVMERLAAELPHAERATLAGAGHSPHRTHPAEYASLLASFWADHSKRGRTGLAGRPTRAQA